MEGYQSRNVLDKDWSRSIFEFERRRLYVLLCLAALCLKACLAGRSCVEAQDQLRRWGEVPRSGEGPHLSYQLILPPLPTGPNQTLTRGPLEILPFVRLALKICEPVEKQVRLTTGELSHSAKQKSLEQSKKLLSNI